MKIRITRACGVAGVTHAIGDIVEPTDRDARYLVAIGKAVPHEEAQAHAATAILTTETAPAVVESKKRRGK